MGNLSEALNWYKMALQRDNKIPWDLNMCCQLSIKLGTPLQEIIDTILNPNITDYINSAISLLNLFHQYKEQENNNNSTNESNQRIHKPATLKNIGNNNNNASNNNKEKEKEKKKEKEKEKKKKKKEKEKEKEESKNSNVSDDEMKNVSTVLLKLGDLCHDKRTDENSEENKKQPRTGFIF
jgi:hypothetical protein